ncbi:MAG: prepilin-type N-terminal cleavage/methylation domain-containing protein [Candidatus Eisenbacteria bacterium]
MNRTPRGFTLIELMIVVVIIGILAAIAIPNFVAMQNRAKEGSTKANMHTFQLAAEDYAVDNDGRCSNDVSLIASRLQLSGANFRNPFNRAVGVNGAFEYQGTWTIPIATTGARGMVAYGDSANFRYQIAGHGQAADFPLILSSGQ